VRFRSRPTCDLAALKVPTATMRLDTRDWLAGLRGFVAEHRQHHPLPEGEAPTPAWAAERAILASHLATRLAEIDMLLARRRERNATAEGRPDPDPALVLSTSPPGITACSTLLDPAGGPFADLRRRFAPVTELEYRLWCIRAPDEGRLRHVNLWSWVKTRVPQQRHAEFSRHRLGSGEAYWLHRTGIVGAGAADTHACHLWKFDGRQASLLEPFIHEGVAGPGAGSPAPPIADSEAER
jgi:hypothetical protein